MSMWKTRFVVIVLGLKCVGLYTKFPQVDLGEAAAGRLRDGCSD